MTEIAVEQVVVVAAIVMNHSAVILWCQHVVVIYKDNSVSSNEHSNSTVRKQWKCGKEVVKEEPYKESNIEGVDVNDVDDVEKDEDEGIG